MVKAKHSKAQSKVPFPGRERIVVASCQVTQQEPADVAGGTGTGSYWNRTAWLVSRDVQHARKKTNIIRD